MSATPPGGGATYEELFGEPIDAPRRRRWFQRPSAMLVAGIVVVAGISLAVDFPLHASHVDQVSAVKSYVTEIVDDVKPCEYSLDEALYLRGALVANSLTTPERAQVPALLTDDEEQCSFLEDNIVDLGSMATPRSVTGIDLHGISVASLAWVDPDALGTIEDIALLVEHPTDTKVAGDLGLLEGHLLREQRTADSLLASAARTLRTTLPALPLSSRPSNS